MDDFAAMVESSRAEAQNYGRDLEAGAAALEENGGAAALAAITREMIERTKAAECQLGAARDEAQALRVQLAEAGEEARRDTLTSLPNRRAFEERLADYGREGVPISIAICDIDHFKRVNDTYGHAVGDRVLKLVADILDQHCGQHMVARLGGEEFVVLFERLGPAAAARHLDAARNYLATKQFKVRETDEPLGKISFSAGIASGADALGRADACSTRPRTAAAIRSAAKAEQRYISSRVTAARYSHEDQRHQHGQPFVQARAAGQRGDQAVDAKIP